MEQVSPVLAKSAGWAKPADLSGMVIGRNLMCCKTEVSAGNLVSPAGCKNCISCRWEGNVPVSAPCASVALLLLCTGIQVPLGVTGASVRKREKNKLSLFLWEG